MATNYEKLKRVTLEHFMSEFRMLENYKDEGQTALVGMKRDKIEGAYALASKLGLITLEEYQTLKQFGGN